MSETLPKEVAEITGVKTLDPRERDMPEYIQFARTVRRALEQGVEEQGYPELPENIQSAEDFFEAAKTSTHARWRERVLPLLTERCAVWADQLPDSKGLTSIKNLLRDPSELETKMEIHQFGLLEEPLRTHAPQAWQGLLAASAEMQLGQIALLRKWAPKLNDEQIDRIGLNRDELSLFLDIAGITQKYIDQGYFKQIQVADLGKESGEGASNDPLSSNRLYRLDGGTFSYGEVFDREVATTAKRLGSLAVKTKDLVKVGRLPQSYQSFADYIDKLGITMGSHESDPDILEREWRTVYDAMAAASEAGCPLMVIPTSTTSVAGEANVDIDLRLGLKTAETNTMEIAARKLHGSAQRILDGYAKVPLDDRHRTISEPHVNYQPFAGGPNQYWMTRGEEFGTMNVGHANSVLEVSRTYELPLLEKLFGSQAVDSDLYSQAAIIENASHELGHTVMSADDHTIVERIGDSEESSLIEELKAELVGMKIIGESAKQSPEDFDASAQLMAKLGVCLDFLINKGQEAEGSGFRYYGCAVVEIGTLLESGALQRTDQGYVINNPDAGVAALSQKADEILAMYADPATTPESVQEYINHMLGHYSSLAEFQKLRKSLQ